MAIILDTSPAGAIASYADLVAELRDLQDNASYDGDVIDKQIRKAEAYFLRKLRLADMEISTTLAVSDATAALPTDCREIRAVIWQGSAREYPLDQMTLAELAEGHGGESAAQPYAYAREGTTLRFGPVASGTIRLVYFANLEPLSDANPTNWMLEKAPDLYVAGTLFYLAEREHDYVKADRELAKADAIIDSLQQEANRTAGGSMVPFGIAQVCGGRA
jgi:hypothetical protein